MFNIKNGNLQGNNVPFLILTCKVEFKDHLLALEPKSRGHLR
jgi:hypothetical protein